VMHVASTLALTDPAAARALLERVFPAGRPIAPAGNDRREALFALALADPERAAGLVDQKVAAAKASKDGLSGSGVVELLQILTAAGDERVRMLGRYGGGFGDLADDED
jgi:hypothetical protein